MIQRVRNAIAALRGRAPQAEVVKTVVRRPRHRIHAGSSFARSFDMGVVNDLFPASAGAGASINADLFMHNASVRKRARDEAQNNPAAKRALSEVRRNVVGKDGIRLQPMFLKEDGTNDEFDNRLVSEAFLDWSRRGVCDVTGQHSLDDIFRLCSTTERRDGEIFVREVKGWKGNKYGYALQLIEARGPTAEILPSSMSTAPPSITCSSAAPASRHPRKVAPTHDTASTTLERPDRSTPCTTTPSSDWDRSM